MSIRTTITLDDDVSRRARDFSAARGVPFRQALNDLVRAGLQAEATPRPKQPFRIEPKRMGFRPGLNYDNIGALLDLGEGEHRR